MDDLDAPQWADFIAPSPQISMDDYFLKRHDKHEYRDKCYSDENQSPLSIDNHSYKKHPLNKSLASGNEAEKTPVKADCSKANKSSSSRKNNVKETAHEHVLMEAMSNLQLSLKSMSGDKPINKSCLMDSPAFETPKKRVTRSMCVQATMTPKSNTIDASPELQKPTTTDQEHKKSMPRIENLESSNERNDPNNETIQDKTVASFSSEPVAAGSGSKKKPSALTGTAWQRQVKRRKSLTTRRRISIMKPPASVARVEQLRRVSIKLQRAPQSPVLTSNNRSQAVKALSGGEQARLKVDKIKQANSKENPLRKDATRRPGFLKIEKKIMTNSRQPFKPSQAVVKRVQFHTKTVPSIVSSSDKGVLVKDEQVMGFGIPLEPCKTKKKSTKIMPFSFEARNKELQAKKEERLRRLQESTQQKIKPEFHARPVPAAVKTPINKLPLKCNTANKPKITIPRSLSFEDRNRELQRKKEEKIKQLMAEARKMPTFKAQKVPEFKPVLVRGRSKDSLLKRSQENLSTKMLSVGSSSARKANASLKKSQETSLTAKPKKLIKAPLAIPFVGPKKASLAMATAENQENRGAVPKILEPKCKFSRKSLAVLRELNADKLATKRKEIAQQLKKKEMQEAEARKREDEERISREKAENIELRKRREIKARPMPVYKPMHIFKSNKPLTEALSPACSRRKGSTH